MKLWKVLVKDSNGNWRQVKPSWFRRKSKTAKFAAAKSVRDNLRKRGRSAKIRKSATATVKILVRADWNAAPPKSPPYRSKWSADTATIVHHTAGSEPKDRLSAKHEMKSIQTFHQKTRGWSDIAYNFLISPQGDIFEGRGVDVRNAASGSNEWNKHCAIAFMGNYSDKEPTDASVAAYHNLRRKLGLRGAEYGHRDVYSGTSCPGNGLAKRLRL